MEANRRNFLKKHSNPQFKRKGALRKGQGHISVREQSPESSHFSETVYRILCQSKKIGSVIGKGGNIVKALREETQAKITVSDSVPGSDERVIIIFSPSDKRAKGYNDNKDGEDPQAEREDSVMNPHCAAQDALLKVHDRIAEEDLGGAGNEDENEIVITARLLVPNNVVGCLLGRKGDVIQRLRSETGANIRVLPADHLPACAMSTDELVQISGEPAIAKKALYEVSTLLHQNPRKDKPPLGFPAPHVSQGFPPGPPLENMLPPGNSPWWRHDIDSHSLPPMPWKGEYRTHPSGYGLDDFDSVPSSHGREAPSEFTMKILCSAEKIGSVIGKGGFNVKQLQQETGASIHVENASVVSDERVIRVSSFEVLWEQRSQTIDAILLLQNRTSEYSEKGTITTRLLVPSSKVGCILGQGGHVINEMRRRTNADIRVFSKEDKPKCSSEDEELVQISGNVGVAKDALAEIASRLRTRCLRDVNTRAEPGYVKPIPGFGSTRNFRDGGLPLSSSTRAGSSGRHEYLKDYEPPGIPVPQRATGYPSVNHVMEAKISNNAVSSVMGTGGSYVPEIVGTRMKLQDPRSGGADFGASEHFNASQSSHQSFVSSMGPNNNHQQGVYQSYNSQYGVGTYPNMNPSQVPYYDSNPRQAVYENVYSQQGLYQKPSTQGPYQY
ncbi:KH domain-containing At4g18375-like [Olea europaea subsp. europaea]|uniref:KH domain-containing At4g18375-like n=1 Tax=Olea europaea subsp. europaea TaxID=158383 RepID=A0A8S0TID5_OLEEU|nr:KH domain-containing At4g18375-like [Olea europaea subsp. europaea]